MMEGYHYQSQFWWLPDQRPQNYHVMRKVQPLVHSLIHPCATLVPTWQAVVTKCHCARSGVGLQSWAHGGMTVGGNTSLQGYSSVLVYYLA